MREFTLTNPERTDVYVAINFGTGKKGFSVNEQLEVVEGILKPLCVDSAVDVNGNRLFGDCKESQVFKFANYQFKKIIDELKIVPWTTAEKGIQVKQFIRRLEGLEDKPENESKDK